MLFKRLFRDIKMSLGQFISILLVIAVGSYFFAGMLESSKSIGNQMDDFYKSQNFADATGSFIFANDKAVENVSERDDVIAAEGRFQTSGNLYLEQSKQYNMMLTTLTESINIPYINSGALPKFDNECMVDLAFAVAMDLEVGDTVKLFSSEIKSIDIDISGGIEPTFDDISIIKTEEPEDINTLPDMTITGIYQSPEYVYKVNQSNAFAPTETFAAVLVLPTAANIAVDNLSINAVLGESVITSNNIDTTKVSLWNQIIVDVDGDTSLGMLFDDLSFPSITSDSLQDMIENSTCATYIEILSNLQSNHPSEAAFRSTFTQISNLIFVLPFIFFLVAAVITFISLSKTVENQRTQIGIMQAIGVKKSNIYWSYLLYAVIAALMGSLIGGIAGLFTLPYIYSWVFSIQFMMPPGQMALSPIFVFIAIGISVIVAMLAAFMSCHRTLKEIPAAALRPKPVKKTHAILAERWKWFWNKIGFSAKMVIRSISINKMRILMSSIGVVGCITLLIAGIGLKGQVSFVTAEFVNANNQDIQLIASNQFDINEAEKEKIMSLDSNVQDVIFAYMTRGSIIFGDESSDVMTIIGVPKQSGSNAVNLYSDEHSKDLIEFDKDNMLVIPHTVAEKYDIEVGDVVTMSTLLNGTISLPVTEIAYQHILGNIYVNYDVCESLGMPNSTSLANVYLKDSSKTQESIDLLTESGESSYIYSATSIADVMHMVDNIIIILDVVVAIIIIGAAILSMTVIYNITAINLFERTREIATLMVLGYNRRETARYIMAENMVTTALGCLIGLPFGYGLFYWLVNIVNSMQIALPPSLPVWVVFLAIGLTFVFSIIATLFLNRKLRKINMVESLKSVE